jgi:hypothetical protein
MQKIVAPTQGSDRNSACRCLGGERRQKRSQALERVNLRGRAAGCGSVRAAQAGLRRGIAVRKSGACSEYKEGVEGGWRRAGGEEAKKKSQGAQVELYLLQGAGRGC